ncbi:MAG: hypothetical protein IKX25_10765 [Bacteroidales bacterium]|nr:hypothetical protein [Bacteroidales bacterium]
MADNYLERQQEALEQRKAQKKTGKKQRPINRKRFYTRPVITKTHEELQAEIAQLQQNEKSK